MADTVNGRLKAREIKRFGWTPDLPDARDYMYSAPEAVLMKLPTKVDLRGTKMPKVYDQGELGSCTANAIGAAFEFGQIKQGETDFMPSRLFIYYNERAVEGTIDTDSGAMIRDGMKSVAKLGVCTEDTWPYDIPKFTREAAPRRRTRRRGSTRRSSTGASSASCTRCRAASRQGYPFVFGFSVYESFMSPDVAKTGKVPLPPRGEQLLGGHAVLAVGYDDSIQSFIVRNSWGPKWGDQGLLHDAVRLSDRPAARPRLLGRLHGGAGRGAQRSSSSDAEEEHDQAEADSGVEALTVAAEFDRGPSQAIASLCLRCPRPGKPKAFWTDWGPIFYRGRLDGTARLLCIASDPGPTERIAHRTLVGDAGQRVQGFLAKLGLTHSYLCVNAFPYALHPSWGMGADAAPGGPGPDGVAKPVLRRRPSWIGRRRRRLRRKRPEGARPLAAQAERPGRAHPASEQPRCGAAPLRMARRRCEAAADRSRPTPTETRPARTTARRSRSPTTRRSPDGISRSACRISWATTLRAARAIRGTTTRSRGPLRTTATRWSGSPPRARTP